MIDEYKCECGFIEMCQKYGNLIVFIVMFQVY